MKNQRLPVQFQAPDDGRCVAQNMLSFIQIWNNKNFDTLLHLVGFFFTNCLGICFTVLTMSTNYMSNNFPHTKNQRLPVQFQAPDDGRCVARNMLNFIQIWNNKNFDTLLHLVGFFFTNCLDICFTVLNLHVLRYSSAQHCSVQFVMPCFLGLQLVMYFALHSIINVPFHAV